MTKLKYRTTNGRKISVKFLAFFKGDKVEFSPKISLGALKTKSLEELPSPNGRHIIEFFWPTKLFGNFFSKKYFYQVLKNIGKYCDM